MAIVVQCACGTQLKARDEMAGRKGKCPSCGATLLIPVPSPPPVDDDGEAYAVVEAPPTAPAFVPPVYQESIGAFVPADQAGVRAGRKVRTVGGPSGSPVREYLYLILIAALVPLAGSLLLEGDDVEARFDQTVMKHIDRLGDSITDEGVILSDEFFAKLPENRIEGAHLPYKTTRHWIYAMIAALGFFGLLLACFPGAAVHPGKLIGVGLFTGTIGIIFLLVVQFLAGITQGIGFIRGRGPIVALFYLAKFIGFSYRAALDPANGFWWSFFGFTFGVGLCEEICKALPLFRYHDADRRENWRAYCLLGLASGIGFGVSEGIMYSGDHYNGIHTAGIYVVRFVSCVALHALWSASVGVALAKSEVLLREMEGFEQFLNFFKIVGVPMILHGLYDTTLKREMNVEALAIAAISFGWLCWQVESARRRDPKPDREASDWPSRD